MSGLRQAQDERTEFPAGRGQGAERQAPSAERKERGVERRTSSAMRHALSALQEEGTAGAERRSRRLGEGEDDDLGRGVEADRGPGGADAADSDPSGCREREDMRTYVSTQRAKGEAQSAKR